MRTLILAAGFGTRLRPLTEHMPKALLPVCGFSILERNLAFFDSQGIGPLAVNSHYRHEQIEAFQRRSAIPFHISHEKEAIRGPGGALYAAREFLGHDEVFCVSNAEPIASLDMAPVVERFSRMDCACALVCAPAESNGTVAYDPQSGDFLGALRLQPDLPGRQALYIGIALCRREVLSLVTEKDFDVVPIWKRAGERYGMKVIETAPRFWRDVGTMEEYAGVHFEFLEGSLDLDIPQELVFDRERKAVFPRAYPAAISSLGPRVWVQAGKVPPDCRLSDCVVLDAGALKAGREYTNRIVTPWGEVNLAET